MPPTPPRLDEHGFPVPTTFDGQPESRGPSRTFQFVWRSALVLAFIAVLLGVLFQSPIASGAKLWAARQLVARAWEKEHLNDPHGALADLDRAANWAPDHPHVLYFRAHLKLTLNDVEGSLEDFNAIVKLDRRFAPAYVGRSSALQRLHRHREAIDDLTHAIKLSDSRAAMPRNNRAYARAIAGLDIADALADVQQAIAIVGEELAHDSLNLDRHSLERMSELKGQNAAYLDTRGYIYFLEKRYEDALSDLNQAIQLADEFRQFKLPREPAAYRSFYEKQFDRELSVMYHHRGQVYEKLGRPEESRADLDLATQLGYNPAEGVF